MIKEFNSIINNYPKIDQLEFVVTTNCNLACTYCYINQNEDMMSVDTMLIAIDKLQPYLADKIDITLFGGEPLLNLDCVYAVKELQEHYKDRINGVTLITNGTLLTDEIMRYVRENNIGLSVSWDGEYETQKSTRPIKCNDCSYEFKFEKLTDLLMKYNHKSIKAMISPNNINNLVQNAEYFKNLGYTHLDFSIVRDDIWTDEDITMFKINVNFLYMLYKQEKWASQNIRIGLFDLPIHDYLAKITGNNREYSCFAGSTGVAVMPNGDIYPCARFATNKLFKLGNIETGMHTTLDELNARNVLVQAKKADYTQECSTCIINSFCYLGCLYSQLVTNNTALSPIASICTLSKTATKYAFRLYKEDTAFRDFLDKQYYDEEN